MCCGSRMFWFDKSDERAIFSDIRKEGYTLRNGRRLIISPDIIADFRALSFADASFRWLYWTLRILRVLVITPGWERNMDGWIKMPGVMIRDRDLKKPFGCWGRTAFWFLMEWNANTGKPDSGTDRQKTCYLSTNREKTIKPTGLFLWKRHPVSRFVRLQIRISE